MPTFLRKNDPIDFSFLSFLHPSTSIDSLSLLLSTDENASRLAFIADRTKKGALPDFGDVKVFVDELLISSQSNRSIEYQLERTPFSCTPFRRDFIYGETWNEGKMG